MSRRRSRADNIGLCSGSTLIVVAVFVSVSILRQTRIYDRYLINFGSFMATVNNLKPLQNNDTKVLSDQDATIDLHKPQHFAQLSSQYNSRRNNSRNLCGSIPPASPKANRFPTILQASDGDEPCRSNAIFYLVQKGKHSTYNRNSMALFIKSLDLLFENYLSINQHYDNVDVLIVHSGDYLQEDLDFLDQRFNHTVHFKLVDVSNSDYWTIPEAVQHDNASQWNAISHFSLGYHHMIRWYTLKLYDFIRDYGTMENGCKYQYMMRMDEDSFIYSPIAYDLFRFMQDHEYSYGYRICSYELIASVWEDYADHMQHCGMNLPSQIPYRQVQSGMCAFYNNFFIADLQALWQPEMQHFLHWADTVGMIYREKIGDLHIQSVAVYAFIPPQKIHRFLDWTYEHITFGPRCPLWGALQAGYLDSNVTETFERFLTEKSLRKRFNCRHRQMQMPKEDLSPTYSHLPLAFENVTLLQNFQLRTVGAGFVEVQSAGNLSG